MSRLIDGYADRIIDADTYQRKAAQYRAQIADADIEAKAAQHTVSVILTGLDRIIDSLSDPMSLWLNANVEARNRIVKMLSGGFVVENHPTPSKGNKHADETQVGKSKIRVARLFPETSNPVNLARRIIEAFAA